MVDQATVLKKEMAVSHADFFRSLPNALVNKNYKIQGACILIEEEDRTWTIKLGPEQERRIGLLALPKTLVTMVFDGYSDQSREKALEYFDRAFQRAGG